MPQLFNQNWSKSELLRRVGHMEQIAGIRLSESTDGKARGSRMLDVWTGSGLTFQVNAERALDICRCEFKGIPLAWRSSVGDVHPAFFEPQGLGWLRSFAGGLLTTCGLNQFGSPSQENGVEYGLHGRISNLPASQVNYRTYWDDDEYQLDISGETRQTAVFAENILLERHLSSSLASNKIIINDVVTNEGFDPTPHMILYHFNLGFPLVGKDTALSLHAESTLPRDADAEAGLSNWNLFQEPAHGFREQVFIHRMKSGENGKANVELKNPDLGLGLRWTFDIAALPYLMEWKMMGEGTYVVGIEPANCNGLGGRAATREKGELPMLEPGESRRYEIEIEVTTNQDKNEQ